MRLATSVWAAAVMLATLTFATPITGAHAAATPSRFYADIQSTDGVLRWINAYRAKPDPVGVPTMVQAMSRLGALKDPEQAGVYTGFLAGVIHDHPDRAEAMIAKMLPLPPGDQWVIVRAVAYSGHPDWRNMLRRLADRVPARRVMIDKFLSGQLPTLWQIPLDQKPSTWETVKSYVTLEKLRGEEPRKKASAALEPSPELLDTFWGYYFATGANRPVWRIIAMLPMSKENDSVEKLTLGNMAKFTLATNALRDMELLAMLKRARDQQSKETATILTEVIDAAETVETARLRRDAMASIEELKRKGPGSKRNMSMWGQVGQGAIAIGCIAAAATGHVEVGLPCVIGGGMSSAAMSFWEKQQ
jgi:hypothetical protein